MFNGPIWEMRYLVSPPSPEVVAARPQSAQVVAPMRPHSRSAHPSGTCGTNLLLGLGPTALAQTPCRMGAAISTTEKNKLVSAMSNFYTYNKNPKLEKDKEKRGENVTLGLARAHVHGLRRGFPRRVGGPGAAWWARRSRGNSWFGGRARGWT